jgi:hypothetical protein
LKQAAQQLIISASDNQTAACLANLSVCIAERVQQKFCRVKKKMSFLRATRLYIAGGLYIYLAEITDFPAS